MPELQGQAPLLGRLHARVSLSLIPTLLGLDVLRYPASKSAALLGRRRFLADLRHWWHSRWQRCSRPCLGLHNMHWQGVRITEDSGENNSECCGIVTGCLHTGQGSTFPRASSGAFNVLLQWGQLILKDIGSNPQFIFVVFLVPKSTRSLSCTSCCCKRRRMRAVNRKERLPSSTIHPLHDERNLPDENSNR